MILRTYRFLVGAKDSLQLKLELKQTQTKLGEKLASLELGDQQIRTEIQRVAAEITGIRQSQNRVSESHGTNKSLGLEPLQPLLDKQADLFSRLGKLYVSENPDASVPKVQSQLDAVRLCEVKLNQHQDEMRQRKKSLLTTDSTTNMRAIIGLVCILLLLVYIFRNSSSLFRSPSAAIASTRSAFSTKETDKTRRNESRRSNDERSEDDIPAHRKEHQLWQEMRVAIKRGDQYREAGELQKAVDAYKSAFELQPYSALAFNGNGQVSMLLEQWNDAYEFFSKAIRKDESFTPAYVNRARCSIVVGEYRKAIYDLDKAVQLDPTKAEVYSFRSHAHRELGNHDTAIRDAETAIRMDAKLAEPYFSRGWIKSLNPDSLDDAISDLTITVKKDPKHAMAYHVRGTIYLKQDKKKLAFDDFSEAIKANPKLSAAYSNRALLAAMLNDHRQATVDFTSLLKSSLPANDEIKYLLARGESYNALKQYSQAVKDFDRVLTKKPGSVEALQNRSVAKKGLGDTAGAEKDDNLIASMNRERESRNSVFSNVFIPSSYSGGYSSSGNGDYYYQRAVENAQYEARRAMNEYRQHTAGNLGAIGFYYQ